MIDVLNERIVTLAEASKIFPTRPSLNALHRWHSVGVAGGIKFETAKIAGRRVTSVEAIQRFIERTTAAANGDPIPVRSKRQREQAVKAAKKELEEAVPA